MARVYHQAHEMEPEIVNAAKKPLAQWTQSMGTSPYGPHWNTPRQNISYGDLPVVGVTVGDPAKAVNYSKALEAAGLRVRLLYCGDSAKAAMQGLSGLVLTGGGDIDPALQGVENSPTVSGVNPQRDLFERAAFELAWQQDMPVLGICRGMQVMNWTLGGTLHQDLDTEVAPCHTPKGHRQVDRGIAKSDVGDPIFIEPGSALEKMFGVTELGVNHDHHQGVKDVAPELKVTARAADGVIEGIEAPGKSFVVGVQFHPELMWMNDSTYMAPFAAFANKVAASMDPSAPMAG
jgi:putative glutamine amidotransferase